MYSFLIKEIDKNYSQKSLKQNYEKILITMTPIIPHFSNECIEMLRNKTKFEWPTYDESQLIESTSLIVIQINGKKRGLINVKNDIAENELIKLINSDKKLVKYLENKEIKRKIYIKNKLINIII